MYFHPTKNGKVTPEMLVEGTGKLLWWQCELGHEWQQRGYAMLKTKGHLCPTCRKTKWLKPFCLSPWLPSSSFYCARRNIDVIQGSYHRQSVDGLVAIPRIRKRLNARSPLNPAEPFPVLLPEELCAGSLFIYCNESRIWWLSLVVRANIKKRPRKKRG